jgi:predicted DNA-binding transcriptional regulator AlpA
MGTIDGSVSLLTPHQVAIRLGITERSVREKAYAGTWPHRRIDKRTLRFTESDYEEIVASALRSATTTMQKVGVSQLGHDLAALLTSRRAA